MKTTITFAAFMLAKGHVNLDALHPKTLLQWRAAYEAEVPADQREVPEHATDPLQNLHAAALPKVEASADLPASLYCAASEDFTLEAAADNPAALKKFAITGYTGGAMRINGWPYPVVVDLAGLKIPRQDMPALMSHDGDKIVGHTTEIVASAQRLRLAGVLSGLSDTEQSPGAIAAREIVRLGKNGFPWQASVGVTPLNRKFVASGESFKANGRNFDGPAYHLLESELYEISFVPNGADSNSSATIAAHLSKGTPMNPFDQWLTDNGFDPALVTTNVKQKAKLEAQHKAETAPPPPTPPPPPPKVEGQGAWDETLATIEAENRRIEHIRETTILHAKAHIGNAEKVAQIRELGESAIADKAMTAQKFDLAMLRADRANAPIVLTPKTPLLTESVVQAAFCKYTGLPDRDKRFDEQTLTAADKHFGRGGLGLLQLIDIAARRNGWRGQSVKTDLSRALKAAFRDDEYRDIQASTGPSTYSISNVLSNTANLHIRDAFNSVEAEWRKIAFISSVNDYKEITTVALTGDMTYKKVARGGEVKHGSFGDMTYGNKADIFALLIGIDEQDLVDDSPRALTSMSRRIGRGGALTMNAVFWAEWLDDLAFFNIDKSKANYDDGATDSMLTAVGLTNMNGIFRAQTDPDGKPLGVRPRILLVPPALEGAALTLMGSEFAATTGEANIWRNRFQVVSRDYLTNPLAWYLLANPQDMPAIEMVFLNGQEMPTTEQADMAIDRLGIVIRGKHSFGARKQEYRAANKAKGAA